MKLFFETWRWRLAQFQAVLAPAFYITTLTLLIYPYVSHRLEIDGIKGAMLIIWVCMAGLVMLAAWVWTDILKMWRTAQEVNVMHRNQFTGEAKLTFFARRMLTEVYLPIMKAEGADTARVEAWLNE